MTRPTLRRSTALVLVMVLLAATLPISALAQDNGDKPPVTKMDWHRISHQVGGRLGIWSHIGEDSPTEDETGNFRADFSDQTFYLEGFVGLRISPLLFGEFSLGVVDRGDVTIQEGIDQRIGSLLITSFLLHARLYPIPNGIGNFVPWVSVGGGLYYGRRNVTFTTLGSPYWDNLDQESRTALAYSVGAGTDLVLASTIALETQVRWMPVEFSENLALTEDYRGLAFTIGIKYLYAK